MDINIYDVSPFCLYSDSPEGNPGVSSARKAEYFHEEIVHHAHVTMTTPNTIFDVLAKTNWTTCSYFACIATAAMFTWLGGELPVEWMIPAVSVISLGFFIALRL